MAHFLKNAAQDLVATGMKTVATKAAKHLLWWVILSLALLFALGFLSVLAFFGLEHVTTPLWASASVAGFWLLVAGIAALIALSKGEEAGEPSSRREKKLDKDNFIPLQENQKMKDSDAESKGKVEKAHGLLTKWDNLSDTQKEILTTAALTLVPVFGKRKLLFSLAAPVLAGVGWFFFKDKDDSKEHKKT